LKHKLFIVQNDRDTLIAEVATLKEDLASARAAADTTVKTTGAQMKKVESELKASQTKVAALEAELEKAQAELAAANAENAKRKSLIGRLF